MPAPLRDRRDRPLPGRPLEGLILDVHWGRHVCCFTRHEVTLVTPGAFTIDDGVTRTPHPLDEWSAFLTRCREDGPVSVHLPGCALAWCGDCDGSLIGPTEVPGEEAMIAAARARPGGG